MQQGVLPSALQGSLVGVHRDISRGHQANLFHTYTSAALRLMGQSSQKVRVDVPGVTWCSEAPI